VFNWTAKLNDNTNIKTLKETCIVYGVCWLLVLLFASRADKDVIIGYHDIGVIGCNPVSHDRMNAISEWAINLLRTSNGLWWFTAPITSARVVQTARLLRAEISSVSPNLVWVNFSRFEPFLLSSSRFWADFCRNHHAKSLPCEKGEASPRSWRRRKQDQCYGWVK